MNFTRLAQTGFVLIFGTALAVVLTPPASAAEATGCAGSAISTSGSGQQSPALPSAIIGGLGGRGQQLDTVEAPGPGGTESDPFTVDLHGQVVWRGETTSVISPGTWNVSIGGIPLSGSFDNSDHKRASGGTIDLETWVPEAAKPLLQGKPKVFVSGGVTGTGGNCQASGWVQLNGSIAASPVFWTGAGFSALGLLLLAWMFLGTKAVPAAAAAVQGFTPVVPPPPGPPPSVPPTPPGSGGSGS